MDWEQLAPAVVTGLVGGVCGICGAVVGAVLTAGLVFGQAWVNRRWRRQEARAAEKRERLEDRFESVRRYAAAVREFVHGEVTFMGVWDNLEAHRDAEWFGMLVEQELEDLDRRWYDVHNLVSQPAPWLVIADTGVNEALLELELKADECRSRCKECLQGEGTMSEEEAECFTAQTDEFLRQLLERMEEAVENVEG